MDMTIRFPNLGLEISDLGRSLRIFGLEITYGGLLIAAGMLLGLAFVVLEAKRRGEDANAYLGLAIVVLITGFLGARLYYVGLSWNLYKGDTGLILDVRSGGLGFYGGLFGGILGGLLYCAARRLSFMKMADTASMGVLLAQIIGRWADFYNRESFGDYTNNVLAMQLPLSVVRSQDVTDTMRENLVTVKGTAFIQVHPVFFYESAFCLVLFLLLLAWKRTKRFDGEVFLRYLAGYGLGRFFLEWIRTDSLMIPGTDVPAAMVISAALFVVCLIAVSVQGSMAKKRAQLKKRRKEEEYAAEEKAAREAQKEDDALWERLHLERMQKNPGTEPSPEEEMSEDTESGSELEEEMSEDTGRGSELEEEMSEDTGSSLEPEKEMPEDTGDSSESVEAMPEETGADSKSAEDVQMDSQRMSEFEKAVQTNVRSMPESVEDLQKETSSSQDSVLSEETGQRDSDPDRSAAKPADKPEA